MNELQSWWSLCGGRLLLRFTQTKTEVKLFSSAKPGSCDNLKTTELLVMKHGKWIDCELQIMYIPLFCSSGFNFGLMCHRYQENP